MSATVIEIIGQQGPQGPQGPIISIPTLPDATTVDAPDELVVHQGGVAKRATAAELTKGINTINGVINVKDFGAVGDGVADDTAAIQAAIAHCITLNASLYWPSGDYVAPSNLANFWNIRHGGQGKLMRGSDTWYITPTGTQRNILYVTSSGNSANDGFSPTISIPMSTAVARFKDLGSKASAGIWRIQIQGNITWNGVRIQDWPAFAHEVEIWGEAADFASVPTAVWDGTTSTENYAFRAENANAVLNFHFRNIKFINFASGSNSGAIVVWAAGKVLSENIHTDNCPIGIWMRQNYARITHGLIKNASTYGVGTQYGASANIGNLSGGGVTFENCDRAVEVGRNTVTYIQGCTFIGNFGNCIRVSRNSRIRTQSNNFSQATPSLSFVDAGLLSVWTPDNFTGSPDIYPTLAQSVPAFKAAQGSVHLHIQRRADRTVHIVSDGSVEVTDTTSQTLISSVGSGNPTWIPFRLPSFYLYNPEAILDVDIVMALATGAGGELALHAQGANSNTKLAAITIPAVASFQRGLVRLRAYNSNSSSNTWRQLVECPMLGIYNEATTISYGISAIRTNSENLLLFRLYWTPVSTDTTTFINMRSYVEA